MSAPLDRAFFAEDAHGHWAKRIGEAAESVVVLTPRTDGSLTRLLALATVRDVVVLTSVRPEVVGLGYREHLLGLKALLEEGRVDLRVTPRPLTANVLLCDSRIVSTGSQRFTAVGRTEDAVTLGPANSIQGSQFAINLEGWLSAGEALTLDLVELLLERLEGCMDALETAQQDLVDEFEFSVADEADFSADTDPYPGLDWLWRDLDMGLEPFDETMNGDTHATPVGRGLQTALTDSRRTSEKQVYTILRTVGQEWDPYLSLVAEGDVDMTIWKQPLDDGSVQTVSLERLDMYPLILNPSGRMGFARVGKTRITYVRAAVHWTGPVMLSGALYDLRVSFPEEGLEQANMHLTLIPVNRSSGGVLAKVRFDGMAGLVHEVVALQNGDVRHASLTSASAVELEVGLREPDVLEDLLARALRPFRFKTLGRDHRNAETFFPRGLQRVRLFRYGDRSVLAVSDARLR